LQIRSGSGLWAIQAALQFPTACVTAIDLQLIPRSELPSNLEMRILNLIHPLPFQDESFDIIHARLVFIHVSPLCLFTSSGFLKPGGWLVIDDHDAQITFINAGPATVQVLEVVKGKMRNPGVTFAFTTC
ncbi:hypothetical protein BU17DRAFT_45480, partial [Hysterangium stoloniferum]